MYAFNLSRSWNLNLVMDMVHTSVLYTTLYFTFKVGKQMATPKSTLDNFLYTTFLMSSPIINLIHFAKLHSIKKLNYSHGKDILIVTLSGRWTSVAMASINTFKLFYFYSCYKYEYSTKIYQSILVTLNFTSLYFCWCRNFEVGSVKGMIYYKLTKLFETAEGFLILFMFLSFMYFNPDPIIKSFFKLCLLVIVMIYVRRAKRIKDSPQFFGTISGLYPMFFVATIFSFFNFNQLILHHFRDIKEIYEVNDHYFIFTLILGVLCVRFSFHVKMKLLLAHICFTNFKQSMSIEEMLLHLVPRSLVNYKSFFCRYFLDKLVIILDISVRRIFNKDYTFRKSFISSLMRQSAAVRVKMHRMQEIKQGSKAIDAEKHRARALGHRKHPVLLWKEEKSYWYKSMLKSIFQFMIVKSYENFEIIFRIILQIACTFYVYKRTELTYNQDLADIMVIRLTNFPIMLVFTFWVLVSTKINDKIYLERLALWLIIPTFLCLEIWDLYSGCTQTENILLGKYQMIEDVLISLFIIHTLFLVLASHEQKIRSSFLIKLTLKVKHYRARLKHKKSWFIIFEVLYNKMAGFVKYFFCCCMIACALLEVSVFDFLVIFVSVRAITNLEMNGKAWFHYIFKIDIFILTK